MPKKKKRKKTQTKFNPLKKFLSRHGIPITTINVVFTTFYVPNVFIFGTKHENYFHFSSFNLVGKKQTPTHTYTTAPFDDISLSRSSFGLIVLMGTEQAQKNAWLTIDVWAESLLSVLFSTHTHTSINHKRNERFIFNKN